MKMKKAAALLLSLTITCSLAACGGTSMEGDSAANDSSSTETTADTSENKDTAAPTEATEWKWPSKDELYVGYSQADLASTWRTVESEDMQRAADERGYKITIVNAEGDTEQQLSDVESLLAQGCNVIVITAVDGDAIQNGLVVGLDHKVLRLKRDDGADEPIFGEVGHIRAIVLLVPEECGGGQDEGTDHRQSQHGGQQPAEGNGTFHGIPP